MKSFGEKNAQDRQFIGFDTGHVGHGSQFPFSYLPGREPSLRHQLRARSAFRRLGVLPLTLTLGLM